MAATYESIMSDLKAGKYASIYLLQGDEPYYIDQISGYIENNALTPDERIFNQTVVYGKDTDVRNLDVMARRFPAMAKYQVLIVKEAQDLKKIDDLVYYVQKPQKTTILVLCHKYKTLDKRKKLATLIEKTGVLFTSAKLYENKIPAWIDNYIKGLGLVSNPNSTRLLTEYLGTDLSKISNELDKLAIALPKGATVTPEIIQDNIGISKDYNNFELQNVIARGNVEKAALFSIFNSSVAMNHQLHHRIILNHRRESVRPIGRIDDNHVVKAQTLRTVSSQKGDIHIREGHRLHFTCLLIVNIPTCSG